MYMWTRPLMSDLIITHTLTMALSCSDHVYFRFIATVLLALTKVFSSVS